MLPLNHQVSIIFLAAQVFAFILNLNSIQVLDPLTNLLHLSSDDVSKENLSLIEDYIIASVF